MNEKERDSLSKKFETFVKEGANVKSERRTLEEALQQALDVTTPEDPGDPRHHPSRNKKEERENNGSEWI